MQVSCGKPLSHVHCSDTCHSVKSTMRYSNCPPMKVLQKRNVRSHVNSQDALVCCTLLSSERALNVLHDTDTNVIAGGKCHTS